MVRSSTHASAAAIPRPLLLCISLAFLYHVSYLIARSPSIHLPLPSAPPPMWSADVIAPPVAINSWKQTTLLHSALKETVCPE